ncbi:BPSS1780 family membrane protein [Uliginosibacterium flavum]|uniref:BPSS1780 family membrane protein n=1 Tax=Uliginosibacterium flavum TaxID=1396831 RepID=A0ABV2TH79_9RHOO
MQANKFPARRGWVWLQAGFALWRSAPLALTGSAMTMLMCLLLTMMIPGIGPLLALLLVFPLQVGMFLVCSSWAQNHSAHPKLLFACFTKQRFPGLLALTGINFLGMLLCFMLAVMVCNFDLGSFTELAAKGSTELPPALQAQLERVVRWTSLFFIPLQLASFFAAPLMALQRTPLIKALFFSFVACWRNLGALLVMQLILGLLGILIQLLASVLGLLFGIGLMVLVPVLCATLYSCARDIFGEWPTA